jgi:hypothetical protein
VPYTVIAGTSGPLSRFLPFGQEQNDGIVSVSEATLDRDATATLVGLHSFLMDFPEVRKRVLAAFAK